VTLWSLCKIIYFVLFITQHFCISTDYLSSGANIAYKYAYYIFKTKVVIDRKINNELSLKKTKRQNRYT